MEQAHVVEQDNVRDRRDAAGLNQNPNRITGNVDGHGPREGLRPRIGRGVQAVLEEAGEGQHADDGQRDLWALAEIRGRTQGGCRTEAAAASSTQRVAGYRAPDQTRR